MNALLEVWEDLVELASLEGRFEAHQASRRLVVWAIAGVLALAAFVYVQIALVAGLIVLGLKLAYASLMLAAVYVVIACVIVRRAGRRDTRAGRPFESTRREIGATAEWIQKLFS